MRFERLTDTHDERYNAARALYAVSFPYHEQRGDGAAALALLAQSGKKIILEIDPPVDEISRRRKNFYERAGFAENPFAHVHPPYHAGFPGHPLVVMSHPRALTDAEYRAFDGHLKNVVMKDV